MLRPHSPLQDQPLPTAATNANPAFDMDAARPQHHHNHQHPQLRDQDQAQSLPSQGHFQDAPHGQPSPSPIDMILSRFSRDCAACVVFSLPESNPTLAPWNSIYIPKHYRVPIPGQRQSSPGECDLVLKIFPTLPTPDQDSARSNDIVSPCERCKAKKRDIFQVVGPDPAVPSPQRLFFSTGEIRLFFKICCPPSHHSSVHDNLGYTLTFELHHGKRILLSQTIKNAGPGMVPEPIPFDLASNFTHQPLAVSRPTKRKLSISTVEPLGARSHPDSAEILPRKRSTVMSLANLISDDPSRAPLAATESMTPSPTVEPSSPTTAVVPLSPQSYQHEHEEAVVVRSRDKSLSCDDQTPSSWSCGKDSRSGSERAEETPRPSQTSNASRSGVINNATNGQATSTSANSNTSGQSKPAKKRQEPHELSELGIGQRASANLHAAYVNGQLKERSKTSTQGPVEASPQPASEPTAKVKSASGKPKPSHACPEPDCDKSFSRLFNLRSHMRTHSKARPFVCSSCNFAFSRRHDRDRHAKKHLSEKPYKCIVCEATFVRQDALVRHLRMDGVQNMCMAAMEQKAHQLGENGGGYMLAAKQQAHDEQQLEDRRDADERQKDGVTSQNQWPRTTSEGMAPEGAEEEEEHGQDENIEEGQDMPRIDPLTENGNETRQSDRKSNTESGRDMKVAHENLAPVASDMVLPGDRTDSSRPPSERASHRPPSPHLDRLSNENGIEGISERDTNGPGSFSVSTPVETEPLTVQRFSHYEKGSGHPDLYADDRYGSSQASHAGAFYPSPSRSHSRSHSHSQSYPMGPVDYPPTPYHDLTPVYHGHSSGPPHYHPSAGQKPFQDLAPAPPHFSYQPAPLPHYHPSGRSMPQGQRSGYVYGDHGMDHYSMYSSRETIGMERPSDPWANMEEYSALETDKSIFEAAMGLLRIRASQR